MVLPVHSRLYYGNFVLVGLPAYLQWRLQSVLNAAARLMFCLRRYDHVSGTLATLHWLRLPQQVDFKVAVMAFLVLHGLVPPYLNDLVRVADLPGRRRVRSSSSHQLLDISADSTMTSPLPCDTAYSSVSRVESLCDLFPGPH